MSGLEKLTICACKSRESGQTIYGIYVCSAAEYATGEICTSVADIGDVRHAVRQARQVAVVGTHDVLYVSTLACGRHLPTYSCRALKKAALYQQCLFHLRVLIYTALSIRKCCSNFKDKQDLHTTRRPLHTVLHQRRQCNKAPSMSGLVAANVRARAPSSAVCPTTGPAPFCTYAPDAERHSTVISRARSG